MILRPAYVLLAVLLATTVAIAQVEFLDLERFIPVRTERLRVGTFEPVRRATGVSHPFFLVGTDDVSLAWLKVNRERLLAIQAFGLVVEAPTVDAYRRVAKAGEGVLIRPVDAELIAEHLRLQYYPVLITAGGFFP